MMRKNHFMQKLPLWPQVPFKVKLRNRSISKGRSNNQIVPIDPNSHFRNLNFRSLKTCHRVSFLRAPGYVDVSARNQRSGSKGMCGFLLF